MTTPSLKSRFKHAYFFKLLILFFCITESTLIFTSELHRSSSPQKELSRRAKEVIRDIKTLGPGGPLLPEETSKIEKELILFEKSEEGDASTPGAQEGEGDAQQAEADASGFCWGVQKAPEGNWFIFFSA